ncbi:MAG: hypothetical protein KDA89_09495 [Planctomycetaceae bacterium]|nr:hypothetical protein [Planctomycetaceae bacterium]
MVSRIAAAVALLAVMICSGVRADDADDPAGKKRADRAEVSERESKGPSAKIVVALTREQEESALEFARRNHPELGRLLEQLRRSSSAGFSRGVREVHGTVQRLERLREKQPDRFEYEVNDWKLGSEIRLLTARWVMSQDPELEQQIRSLLVERQTARLQRLQSDREKLADRLENLDTQIEAAEAAVEDRMEAEWKRLAVQASGVRKSQKQK